MEDVQMSDITNFVQRGTYTMLGLVHGLTCFTRALHATEQCFCNDAAFLKVRAHPVLAPLSGRQP